MTEGYTFLRLHGKTISPEFCSDIIGCRAEWSEA